MLCKRGLCRHAVSVRPSVTFVHSVKTSSRMFKFFSPSGSQTILVFRTKRHGNILTGTPLTGALNARGVGKNRAFRSVSGFNACFQRCDRLCVINTAPPDRSKL